MYNDCETKCCVDAEANLRAEMSIKDLIDSQTQMVKELEELTSRIIVFVEYEQARNQEAKGGNGPVDLKSHIEANNASIVDSLSKLNRLCVALGVML